MDAAKYENTTVWLPPCMRRTLQIVCAKFRVSNSFVMQKALEELMAKWENGDKLPKEDRKLIEAMLTQQRHNDRLTISKITMAREGWRQRIRGIIFGWHANNQILPSQDLVRCWIEDGVALGWSRSEARRTVQGYVRSLKGSSAISVNGKAYGGIKQARERRK